MNRLTCLLDALLYETGKPCFGSAWAGLAAEMGSAAAFSEGSFDDLEFSDSECTGADGFFSVDDGDVDGLGGAEEIFAEGEDWVFGGEATAGFVFVRDGFDPGLTDGGGLEVDFSFCKAAVGEKVRGARDDVGRTGPFAILPFTAEDLLVTSTPPPLIVNSLPSLDF